MKPEDVYTPTWNYTEWTWEELIERMNSCSRDFYDLQFEKVRFITFIFLGFLLVIGGVDLFFPKILILWQSLLSPVRIPDIFVVISGSLYISIALSNEVKKYQENNSKTIDFILEYQERIGYKARRIRLKDIVEFHYLSEEEGFLIVDGLVKAIYHLKLTDVTPDSRNILINWNG
jgi:hypothetical protein